MLLGSLKNTSGLIARMSLEDLTLGADVILIGTVENIQYLTPLANVEISIEQAIKGSPGPSPIIVVVGFTDFDEAVFHTGQKVLIFLEIINSDFRVLGKSNGKYTISNGQVLEEGVSESDFVNQINQILGI